MRGIEPTRSKSPGRNAGGADWQRQVNWVLGATLLVIIAALYAGRGMFADASGPLRLNVYALSTQEEVFTQAIFPAFEQEWEAQTGRDLTIEGVFGPSGMLARQINLGAAADVALFSNLQHVTWLKVGRQVQEKTPAPVFGYTPMVIVTRPGNPLGIAEFADLAQPGLRLLHADPRSSGAGEWGVLAEYGSALLQSGNPAAAQAQLEAIWRNARLLGPSARAALVLFELGACDALVTYEQDAYLALERGAALEIVTPPRTIVARHVVVVVDANVTPDERPTAEAFVRYLLGDAGRQSLERYYLRLPDQASPTLPELVQPFTVESLGGWSRAYAELVESWWKDKVEPRIESGPGLSLLDAEAFSALSVIASMTPASNLLDWGE